MEVSVTTPVRFGPVGSGARTALLILTGLALMIGAGMIVGGASATLEPDLARVLRFMAALKAGFALIAWAVCFWRLERPAVSWRTAIYIVSPPLMIIGAAGMWSLHRIGVAALGLHLGLFAMLVAALTDSHFIPSLSPLDRDT